MSGGAGARPAGPSKAKAGRRRRPAARAARRLDKFKPGLGDVAMVLAFTGLRWEEAVAVPAANVDLETQSMLIDRTASESGGRRDIREEMKTRAAERIAMIPDIAVPAVRRLLQRGEAGRERSGGRLYSRLINGDWGGYLGYATWRKYLRLSHGFTAAHKDGAVTYTAHELRHVCASLLIASGASDIQVANQMGQQQDRDDQEHLRSSVRPRPHVHPEGHQRSGQPSLRPRGH